MAIINKQKNIGYEIYLLATVIFFFQLTAQGQVVLEHGSGTQTSDGALIVYGANNFNYSIPYEKIKGSPFWQNQWNTAVFYNWRDSIIGNYKSKLNFVTQEIYYIDKNGKEQVVLQGLVDKVIFFKNEDESQVISVFKNDIGEVKKKAACKHCFVQEMNSGDVKLMKSTSRVLKIGDSLFGTQKRYYFADEFEYFLQVHDRIYRVKKLDKESILSLLPTASSYEAWIREKQLRFKKESDFMVFIDHYNATRRKED